MDSPAPEIPSGPRIPIAAIVVINLMILGVIIGVSICCARKARRAIVSELRTAVTPAPPPPSRVHAWEVDGPTMERFFIEPRPLHSSATLCIHPQLHHRAGRWRLRQSLQRPVPKRSQDRSQSHKQERRGAVHGRGRDYRQDSSFQSGSIVRFLLRQVHELMEGFEKGELMELIEACGITDDEEVVKAKRMAMVALWCSQDSPEARPPMSAVVKMLEGEVEIMPPPKPFNHLYSVATDHALKPPSNETDYSSWYSETTPTMAKYEITVATL